MGPLALALQLGGGLGRVPAEEPGVVDVVAGGVLPRVLHGLGDDLHPQELFGPPGHGEADGAGAAVQVQQHLVPGEGGVLRRLFVKTLRLVVVDLVEGEGGEPEGQATEMVLDGVRPPQGAALLPQGHVGLVPVYIEHHAGKPRHRGPQGLHQLCFEGEAAAVCHHAGHDLPGGEGLAQVQPPQQPLVGGLVVNGDAIPAVPGPEGLHGGGKIRGLEAAAGTVHNAVGVDRVKAHGELAVFPHPQGEQALVPVAVPARCPQDGPQGQVGKAADALQGVPHPLGFQLQLRGVGDVPVAAAPALGELGAVRLHPAGGGGEELLQAAVGVVFRHLYQLDPGGVPGGGEGHEHRHALQAPHPGPLGGGPGDVQPDLLVLLPLHVPASFFTPPIVA